VIGDWRLLSKFMALKSPRCFWFGCFERFQIDACFPRDKFIALKSLVVFGLDVHQKKCRCELSRAFTN
jgi:hypothetical protein